MEAVDEYVEGLSKATSERIGNEAERCRRKAGAPKSAPLAEDSLWLSRMMGTSVQTARSTLEQGME